jgi:adenosine/AMP kinase
MPSATSCTSGVAAAITVPSRRRRRRGSIPHGHRGAGLTGDLRRLVGLDHFHRPARLGQRGAGEADRRRSAAPRVGVVDDQRAGHAGGLRGGASGTIFAAVGPTGRRREDGRMELRTVRIENPDELNLILGQAHFIKTIEDLHEALAQASATLRFGIAFCESSGPRLVRSSGNDDDLRDLAVRNALAIGAGHCFIVFLRDGFPVSVLNGIKLVPEVCRVFCATANPVEVLVAETDLGRGIMGIVDGGSPLGVETPADVADRKALLRRFGYKL